MLSSLAAFEEATTSGAVLVGKHGLCRSVFSKIECVTLTKCVITAESTSTWAALMPGFQVWKGGVMVDSVDDADPKKLKQLAKAHDFGVPMEKNKRPVEAEGAGERKKPKGEPRSSASASSASTGAVAHEPDEETAQAVDPAVAAVEVELAAGRTTAKSTKADVDEAVESGRRVFVANLPYSANDEQMRATFDGDIAAIEWLAHKDTRKFKGSGFLTFKTAAQAAAAVTSNGAMFGGRAMRLDLAVNTHEHSGGLTCVFVRNLPHEEWTAAKVRAAFQDCGAILQLTLPKKGKAAIRFRTAEGAAAAVARDREERGGRVVRVLPTRELGVEDGGDGKGASEEPYLSSHARRGGPKERAAAAARAAAVQSVTVSP